MARLGGSPLGLISVESTPNRSTGMSTFNGGLSRNIKVSEYNNVKEGSYPIKALGNNKGTAFTMDVNQGTRSLFSGQNVIAPYGNAGKMGTETGGGMGIDKHTGINNQLHNNDTYDVSILNIIQKLSTTMASLRPSDFAYLKDIGVYPNNRLMIARRFLSPVGDNIYGKPSTTQGSMATMITWKAQDEDFLDISFGEEWEPARADFTSVLNDLGKDFSMSGGMSSGTVGGALSNVIPLPGFTESLQRTVLQKIGILDGNGLEDPLPSGNPNLIKEAKRRKTIGFSEAGSGLKCKVSIKMKCEWEQKFISGIDPTIVWQDLISTILRFSTSASDTYGLSKKFESTIGKWLRDPASILVDMIQWISDGLTDAVKAVKEGLISIRDSIGKKTVIKGKDGKEVSKEVNDSNKAINAATKLEGVARSMLKTQIQKYRIEIEGIARALSGAPSTPWHITIGNPMRPIFCAGDMMIEGDMALKLGSTLAFNDLPSNITAEFTLTNARNWGLQEILAKFNAGSLRVSAGIKDSNSVNAGEKLQDNKVTGDINKVVDPALPGQNSGIPSNLTNNTSQSLSNTTTDVLSTTPNNTAFQAPVTGIPPLLQTPPDVTALSSTSKESTAGAQIVKDASNTTTVTNLPTTPSLNDTIGKLRF